MAGSSKANDAAARDGKGAATRANVPRIGRVLIARGRDAADVAIATTFGPNTLIGFKIWTDEVAQVV